MTHARLGLVAVLGLLAGCSEELGPESFPTSSVHGRIIVGPRPVAGGFIEVAPAEGSRGNLRVAPIGLDGSFRIDQVPVGPVVVRIEVPASRDKPAVPGTLDVPRILPSLRRSPIRRNTLPGRDTEWTIDLIEEFGRASRGPKGSRRKRTRSDRKSRGRVPTTTDPVLPPLDRSGKPVPKIRIIYRDAAGAIHLEWPLKALRQAIEDRQGVVWVDIEDLESACNEDVEVMLRDLFHFHPLAIEDALKDTHTPKVDDWGDYIYIVVDTLDFDPMTDDLRLHELDLFLGSNFLLSYHNEATEVLERHRRNLEREPEARLKSGPAKILYELLDDVVGEFLPAIEHLDQEIDDAQDEVFDVPTPRTLRQIFHVKRNALQLHRVVIPMREVLNRLARDPYAQIQAEHRIYFRDVYDHLVRIHDIIESLRDLIAGALDTYLSVVSNRTNDIMKALTVVNVMFLPLTFVVGFFGMNFFGETLMFIWPPLPKALMFWTACIVMISTPVAGAIVAKKRGWF